MLDPISARVLAFPQEQYADVAVAILRTEAGRNPLDKGLHDLVGELSTRSDEFRTRWDTHNVRHHGGLHAHHQEAGTMTRIRCRNCLRPDTRTLR